jgi:hypothetical protein
MDHRTFCSALPKWIVIGAAVGTVVFPTVPAIAQSAMPSYLGIQVSPPIPRAQAAIPVQVNWVLTNLPAHVVQVTTTQSGNVVDVSAFVDHSGDLFYPLAIYLNQIAPALAAGTYTFRYVQYSRNVPPMPQTDYSPPFEQSTLTVTVADPSVFGTAVEYYYSPRDHYFMTANPAEIAALDSGAFPGWVRTGQQFPVYLSDPAIPGNSLLSPVCRYYGLPSAGLDSHFFSGSPAECAAVAAAWPTQWLLETPNAFYVFLPQPHYSNSVPQDPAACPFGTEPVYRLYNNRADVNHRYTTSLAIRQQMLDAGWIAEGYGATGVAMCVNNS